MDKVREVYRQKKHKMFLQVVSGLDKREVAERMKVHLDTFYKWHSGEREIPDCYLVPLYRVTRDLRVLRVNLPESVIPVPIIHSPTTQDISRLAATEAIERGEADAALITAFSDNLFEIHERPVVVKEKREALSAGLILLSALENYHGANGFSINNDRQLPLAARL